jgi:AraC-like DNA-binding protein
MGMPPPPHCCAIFPSPWAGVYATLTDSARHFERHSHATYGFGVMEQGAQHSGSGRGPVQAFAGDVMTTNPGEVHDGRPFGVGSRRWRMVHLPVAVLAEMTGASQDIAIARPVIRDSMLARAAQRAVFLLSRWSSGDASSLQCEEALLDACWQLIERHGTRPASRDPSKVDLRPVRDCLLAELAAEPTLAELARLAGISRFHLLRRFRTTFGVTPHALLQQERAERARRLIAEGHPLAEAAAAAGFADQSHMTRQFSRQFGFSPGAWRRAVRSR